MIVGLSAAVAAKLPTLECWMRGAGLPVEMIDPAAAAHRKAVRLLALDEIGQATHRDILIDFRDGAPELSFAADGLPARIGFGFPDMALGHALVSEMLRMATTGGPAIGEPQSSTLMQLAARIAQSDATVLIEGETGTGKEGMARFVHANSPRAGKDFIAVNCAALPETMLEAMLFGHRKGSFTGANAAAEGLFQAANGGTLFLDEIAELPLALQAKLLRALQEKEVLPVGATQPVAVDVRVIAAGNRNLAHMCAEGRFREDLYWRLNVMPIILQPLKSRRQDIRAIAANMLLRHQLPSGRFVWPTAEAMEKLCRHDWPGNARELDNVLQRALVLREGERIEADAIGLSTLAPASDEAPAPVHASMPAAAPARQAAPLQAIARASQMAVIARVLEEVDGHRQKAAKRLGISERTLRYRLADMRAAVAA